MAEQQTIVELVKSRPDLKAILAELVEAGFLAPGIFNPAAYLVDEEEIAKAWKKEKSKVNAIGMGIAAYNNFYSELTNKALSGQDPQASKETSEALDDWKATAGMDAASDQKEIENVCATLGQYLEYMNRKSQGF